MSAPPLQRRLEATGDFLDIWTTDTLLEDIATSLSCMEVDALANLLIAYDMNEDAEALILAHSLGDDEGDEHFGLACSQCEVNRAEEHGMCSSCLHDAYRSGWEPGQ